MYDAASTILQQKLSQVEGVGQVFVGGSSLPAVRVELNPMALNRYGIGLEDVRSVLRRDQRQPAQGQLADGMRRSGRSQANDQLRTAEQYAPLIIAYRTGAPCGCPTWRRRGLGRGPARDRAGQRQAGGAGRHLSAAGRQHHRDGRSACASCCRSCGPRCRRPSISRSSSIGRRPSAPRCATSSVTLVISVLLVILVVFVVPAERARHADPGGGGAGVAHRHLRRDVPAAATASTTCR